MVASKDIPHDRLLPLRIRLTIAGWLLLGLTILVGVATVRSQAPLGFILFGVMVGAVTLSATMSAGMVSSVRLRRETPSRAWQNQTIHISYYLHNLRRRPCLSLSLEEVVCEGLQSVSGYCLHLPARKILRSGSRFVATRRGRIRLRSVDLATVFPFGLVRTRRRFERSASLIIWPARGRLKCRLLHRGAVESSRAAPSRASGGQDEFFGLREYRLGDSPRWIHWRRSATRVAPVVREMSRPLPEILWLLVDTYVDDISEIAADRREQMLRLAATLVDHAFTRDYQVAMAVAMNDAVRVLPPAGGRGQRCELLDALANVNTNATHGFDEIIGAIRKGLLKDSQVIVLSGRKAENLGAGLGVLRTSCRHLTVIGDREIDRVFQDAPAGQEPPCP